jgi:hypothetical protein
VEGADTVGTDTRGYDAGKKVNGRKRFIVTDTAGLLITVDRPAQRLPRHADPALFADQGFAGRLVDWIRETLPASQ